MYVADKCDCFQNQFNWMAGINLTSFKFKKIFPKSRPPNTYMQTETLRDRYNHLNVTVKQTKINIQFDVSKPKLWT